MTSSNLVNIDPGYDFTPVRPKAIIWTIADLLQLIGALGTNFESICNTCPLN